ASRRLLNTNPAYRFSGKIHSLVLQMTLSSVILKDTDLGDIQMCYSQHSDVPVSTVVAGPAVGVTWYIKVDVTTSGANTNFAAYYSAISGGPWTFLTGCSIATLSDAITAGLRFA